MATDDGARRRHGSGEDRPRPRRGPPRVGKPPELDKDFPWPATWERNLGPGGEELEDGLVEVGPVSDALDDAAGRLPLGSAGRAHRRPSRLRLDLRSRAPLLAGVAVGLAGVSALGALVIPSVGGGGGPPSPPNAERTAVTLAVPATAGSTSREWAEASRELNARVEAAAKRRREATRQRLQRERAAQRREREERPRPAPRSPAPPVTTPIAETPQAPTPPADPWPGVSPAERELTPGPWNLS